jgi:hypothetical protein
MMMTMMMMMMMTGFLFYLNIFLAVIVRQDHTEGLLFITDNEGCERLSLHVLRYYSSIYPQEPSKNEKADEERRISSRKFEYGTFQIRQEK